MAARERFNVFPSRTNLVVMKVRMASAQKGYNLLKRKRDVMEMKRREFEDIFRQRKHLAEEAIQRALFSLARLRFLDADIRPYGILKPNKADVLVKINYQKTIGLLLPIFEVLIKPSNCFSLAGLGRGGTEVHNVRLAFQEALRYITDVASMEYSIKVLQQGIRENSTRLNGLEYVVVPRYINTIDHIKTELDEFEREDFYRLKRTKAKSSAAEKSEIEMMRAKRDDIDKYNDIVEKNKQSRRTLRLTDAPINFEEANTSRANNIPTNKLMNSTQRENNNLNKNATTDNFDTPQEPEKRRSTLDAIKDDESADDLDNWDDFNKKGSDDENDTEKNK